MTDSPITPYHPKEFGASADYTKYHNTGLLGVMFLISSAIWGILAALVASPFVLLGVAEYLGDTPSYWRVRWIRKDKT